MHVSSTQVHSLSPSLLCKCMYLHGEMFGRWAACLEKIPDTLIRQTYSGLSYLWICNQEAISYRRRCNLVQLARTGASSNGIPQQIYHNENLKDTQTQHCSDLISLWLDKAVEGKFDQGIINCGMKMYIPDWVPCLGCRGVDSLPRYRGRQEVGKTWIPLLDLFADRKLFE